MYDTLFNLFPTTGWNDNERADAKVSLTNFGMVFIDEIDGKPVRSPFQQKRYFQEKSCEILGKLSDRQLDYCVELGDRISRRLPKSGALEHVEYEILNAQLTGYLDAAALDRNISGEEKEWLLWYFQKDRSGEIIDLRHEHKLCPVRKPSRIEIPAGENTYLVAEENIDSGYPEIYIGLEDRKEYGTCTWSQDIAVVGQEYVYQAGSDKPVYVPGLFSLKVWGDSGYEDFTEEFRISQAGLDKTDDGNQEKEINV